ncbi:hypothetical protein F8C82_02590 [Phaeocystidibacter marisrubri]|uniref:Uncharacterized protein n=2 Tax=Phaeocystidibacter marisrubri TaxID=1577780 RepID=A0A6L3ZI95_9FLAO|nr:hypothetical protein F8C82_02590 [Phaeocystidibacter marisrubri]
MLEDWSLVFCPIPPSISPIFASCTKNQNRFPIPCLRRDLWPCWLLERLESEHGGKQSKRRKRMKNKLLVIGWDAADWSVLNPLLQSGKMPALARLMSGGFHGKLASLQPMLSPLLWTSIATGVRPHQHGVLNFVEVDPQGDSVRAVRGSSRKVKTYWEILYERGVKSNVIGWWPSHPAGNSGGVQVSNFYNRSGDVELDPLLEGTVFPPKKSDEYASLRVHATEMTSRILAPFFPHADTLDGSDGLLSSCAKIIADASSIQAAVTEAMATTEWDVTSVYWDALDHFKHVAMKYHPPRAKDVSEEDFKKYSGVVEAGYRFHDMMLDRLLDLAGDDCHVLLLSDHGFTTGEERLSNTPDIPGGPAAEHHPFGILVGKGPEWKTGEVYGHSLLDICPAILHLFRAPLAENFEGRLPREWWKHPYSSKSVASYPIESEALAGSSQDERRLLSDLQALGYISLPDDDALAKRAVEGDSRYNKVTSLLDGRLLQSAENESERLFMDFPNESRFAYQYLGILLMTNDVRFSSELTRISARFPSISAQYFHGMEALRSGFPGKAVQYFNEVLVNVGSQPNIEVSIAKALHSSGATNEAIEILKKASEAHSRLPFAPLALAVIYDQIGDSSKVIIYAITAIERTFYLPEAHALVAKNSLNLGDVESAEAAYRLLLHMRPSDEVSRKALQQILKDSGRSEEANSLHREEQSPQIIVTGWPRSGSSMMMLMLEATGLELFRDTHREADDSNPYGYFEHEAITRTHVDASWLDLAKGKVAKVLHPQFRQLPGDRSYLVIWMDRPLTEVVLSQEVMLGKEKETVMNHFPFGKAMQMQVEMDATLSWAESAGNMQMLRVSHNHCLLHTKEVVQSVVDFLEKGGVHRTWNFEAMENAVDSALYRSRLT